MRTRGVLASAICAAAVIGLAVPAFGQDQGATDAVTRRVDRLERQLNDVRQIVLQAKSTGAPVDVRVVGSDPEIADLTAKFSDLEQTLQGINAQIDALGHDLNQAKTDAAQANAQTASLADRVAKLEQQVATLTAPPPPPPAADVASPPPPAPGEARAAYAHARELLLAGDYVAASAAFQDYVDRFGGAANAAPARYWLGETKYIQGDYAGAKTAYAGALQGWPQTAWAPDALIKLSLSLAQLNQTKEACGFLGEVDRRYPKASAAVQAHAAAARQKIGCPG